MAGMKRVSKKELEELAHALGLRLNDLSVCQACLTFVSLPLDQGRDQEAAGASRRLAHEFWSEGLALPLQAALERARKRGVAGAAEAIADVEQRGWRARIVPAVIRELAGQQLAEMRASRIGGRNGTVTLLP
jgi:hypothetical protein